jgi:Zn-dependent M28 family amino/carboxypeptidase
MRTIIALVYAAGLLPAQVASIEGARIAAHMKFLSSDLLEGRAPATRGGELTEQYIAAQFGAAGLKPAGDKSTFLQRVPLISVSVEGRPSFSVKGPGGAQGLQWMDEISGKPNNQQARVRLDAEAVFAGYGITAPEYGWNSYKDVDVRGKTVVLFTGEPPSDDPKFFGGAALTYYGRWTYKFEEAARRGAAAALIIHTTPTASYGWNVVRGFSREEPQVRLKEGAHALSFAGWVSTEAAERSFGRKVDDLLTQAGRRDFRPEPLGVRLTAEVSVKLREAVTHNIVGIAPGRDPRGPGEAVVFTSHWDHLGVGPAVNGDAIYNGSLDNASGVAMLIEMARAWVSMEPKPRRSAIFAAVTAEESGLLGSAYLAENPPVPAGRLAANLNVDMLPPFGRNLGMIALGSERTTLWPLMQEMAKRFQLEIKPDPRPAAGSYYRSDHFNFARAGVPAFSIGMAGGFAGKSEAETRDFVATHYHQPSDEWREDFDFSGVELMARLVTTLGIDIANLERLPTWQAGDEFLPARERSGVK